MQNDPRLAIGIAFIAAITALIGAGIAAITAGRRQRRELDHDRVLADISELRSVLDDAARATAKATRIMRHIAENQVEGDDLVDRVDDAEHDLSTSALRVRIRLGRGLTEEACNQLAKSFADYGRTATQGGRLNTHEADFNRAREALAKAALDVAGTRTSTETSPNLGR